MSRKKSNRSTNKTAKVAKKSYLDVQHEHYQFFANDGQILKNISELPKALQNMDAQTFAHHVNGDNNDFANWTEHVFGDKKLAGELDKLKRKPSIIRAIRRHF